MYKNVHTIGYEGSNIEDFVATLILAKISVLVDIRELPLSRKKGFSKNVLGEILKRHRIEYVHLKGLGDPKAGRTAAKSGDHQEFLKIFRKHMKSSEAQADLRTAIEISQSQNACFVCFERDPKCCHRNIVVNELVERTGQAVKHIGVRAGASSEVELITDDNCEYA